jgi:NAD(P)-dependent dehydrogenase (short-subunit alcohol dehydrogenase family)
MRASLQSLFPPRKRAGTPDEIAEAIVYMASASFMTGEVLRVNGGRAAS